MTIEDIFGNFENVYKLGPSYLGGDIIDTSTLRTWFTNNYMQENYESFNSNVDEYLVQNKNRFISGKIYTFYYNGKSQDYWPVFLSLTNKIEEADKLFEIGINLNLLNPKDRVIILNAIVKFFPNQLIENIELSERNERRQVDLPLISKEFRDKFFDVISMRPKFLKLDRSNIMRDTIKTVSYEHWKYLIYYLPTTFVNMSPQEVYKD